MMLTSVAREVHEPAGELQCAAAACAPEVVFARVAQGVSNPEWGPPSDVWAVGATVRTRFRNTNA